MTLFCEICKISTRAVAIICIVLAVRFLFIKLHTPKKYVSLLWLVVYGFMVLPTSIGIETSLNVWDISNEIDALAKPVEDIIQISDETKSDKKVVFDTSKMSDIVVFPKSDKNKSEIVYKEIVLFLPIVYIVGIFVFFIYGCIKSFILWKKLLCSLWLRENIYVADEISEPFVFGIMSPKIYLPTNLPVRNEVYVVEHEKTHIMRKDSLKKVIAFLITGIHWFNPFAYVAFSMMTKDMEMACDEETIQRIGMENRKEYASTLLELSVKRRNLFIPVAFGVDNVKDRIKNIIGYKKTLKIVSVAMLFCVILLAGIFFMKPKDEDRKDELESLDNEVLDEKLEVIQVDDYEEQQMVHLETCGIVNGPFLDYADENYVVFHSRTQFFVYDIQAQNLKWHENFEESFESIDIVMVTKDGSLAYIYGQDGDAIYVYECDIQNGKELVLNLPDVNAETELLKSNKGLYALKDIVELDVTVFQSTNCMKISENKFLYLQSGSGLLEDLKIIIVDSQSNTQIEYPVFLSE